MIRTPRPSPLARLHAMRRLARLARDVGRLDASRELGPIGVAMLHDARRRALDEKCLADEVDGTILDALEEGRDR